jgi:hypothetical protein
VVTGLVGAGAVATGTSTLVGDRDADKGKVGSMNSGEDVVIAPVEPVTLPVDEVCIIAATSYSVLITSDRGTYILSSPNPRLRRRSPKYHTHQTPPILRPTHPRRD